LASFTTLTRSYWASNLSTGSSGSASRRRAPRAPQGGAARVSCGERTAAAAWCGPRAQAALLIETAGHPGVRAQARTSGRGRTRPGVRFEHGEGDGAEGRVPHGSEGKREKVGRIAGPGKEVGRRSFLGRGRKEKKRERWRGGPDGLETKRVRGKSFPFFFPKQTHSNLNLNTRIQIQTEQQTIKQCITA